MRQSSIPRLAGHTSHVRTDSQRDPGIGERNTSKASDAEGEATRPAQIQDFSSKLSQASEELHQRRAREGPQYTGKITYRGEGRTNRVEHLYDEDEGRPLPHDDDDFDNGDESELRAAYAITVRPSLTFFNLLTNEQTPVIIKTQVRSSSGSQSFPQQSPAASLSNKRRIVKRNDNVSSTRNQEPPARNQKSR